MTDSNFTILRSGFDTVELAYDAALPDAFLDVVEQGKTLAIQTRRSQFVAFKGAQFLVEPSGGQGGYAYRLSTGPFGADWKFRDRSSRARDPWTTHVKLRAHGLATKGIIQAKAECDAFLARIGSRFDAENARVARADFAIDVFYPGFVAQAHEFVSHARMGKNENIERNSRGDVCEYLRIGKMPGKQLCIYDKSKKISADRDLIWIDIFQKQFAKESSRDDQAAILRNIWRFEFRAGRNFITDRIGLRRWDKFLALRREVFLPIANGISWRAPSADTNRARWPFHPLWKCLQETLDSQVGNSAACQINPGILKRLRDEHILGLDAQLVGLTLTRAALEAVGADQIPKYVSGLIKRTSSALEERPDLEAELSRRRDRAEFMFGTLPH